MKKTSIFLLVSGMFLIILMGIWLKPIPQQVAYHNFADQRSFFGIKNASNVLSNIPFALVGVWGLILLFSRGRVHFVDNRERILWIGFSLGLILTAVGSSYYHLLPDNSRIVWDRLSITIVFMSFTAALIAERISICLGLMLWPILLGVGFYSVIYWLRTLDLTLYLGLQAFTLFVTLVMLITPSPYNRRMDLIYVIAFFVLAILFEQLDHNIYILSRGIVGGHMLKHISAAIGGAFLIRMIVKRRIL